MPKLELKDGTFAFVLTTEAPADVLGPDVARFVAALAALDKTTPLNWFDLKRVDAGPDYEYVFQAVDGRTWRQTLRIESARASMTFDVPGFWALEEFAHHKLVRDLAVELVRKLGATKAEAFWVRP